MSDFFFFSKKTCDDCHRMDGTVVRVFGSEAEYLESGLATGEEGIEGDPYATVATWPEKNNVGRPAGGKLAEVPVHPRCACSWRSWTPVREEAQKIDWFAEARENGELDKYITLASED